MKTLEISHLLCGLLALGWLSLQAAAQENVALKKDYSQISMFNGTRPSSNAANGNTKGVYDQTNCIKTNHNNTLRGIVPIPKNTYHWWQVDLGRIYPVRDIIVWAMSSTPPSHIERGNLYPFTITVDDQICVSVIAPLSPSNTRNISVKCPSVMYGQKVRLTFISTNLPLFLCEFEILVPSGVSQCPAGHYGAQCKQTCSDNCGSGTGKNFCDQDTGVCYDGCMGHFAGPTCSAAGSRIGQSGGGASILLPLSLGILLAYICQF